MAWDNSSSQLDDKSNQTKRRSVNIYFNDELKNLSLPNWENKKRKHRCTILAKKDCNNTAAWQINSQEKLLIKKDKNFDEVLTMILNMRNIYTKYLNQINQADKQCKKFETITLGLEQEFQINNNER